ncbi:hypothetical protein PHISP_00226 [Aspergillus sp. HF37]|nr:hypothetical protein PHISP_00226 [Aspergillus sp. HF37]
MAPSQIEEPTAPLPTKQPQSLFSALPVPPVDEPFTLNAEYINDPHPQKVNLGIGVYRAESGDPWPLPVVEEAETRLHNARDVTRHEYLTIQGDVKFLTLARDLVFGFDSNPAENGQSQSQQQQADKDRIATVQTVSGTGANRLGAEFLARFLRPRHVWIPEPTWANHHTIWDLAGVAKRTYPYYNFASKAFDHAATTAVLSAHAHKGDVVILHACAHNPTGADPSREQWAQLADLIQARGLVPFFDLAYQGFASGNLADDAFAIRHFLDCTPRIEFCVAQSFSKNFGLYGQRTGALHLVTSSSDARSDSGASTPAQIGLANLSHLVRGEYSMAPRGGSEIVRTVLSTPELRERWGCDLQTMSGRIKGMRCELYDELVKLDTPGNWDNILDQIGMFSYTGLSEAQVLAIRNRHHVYMLVSGRMSMSGLNSRNVRYVARAVDDVVRTVA